MDATLLLRPSLPISEARRADTKARMLRAARRAQQGANAVPEAGSHDGDMSEVHTARVEMPTVGTLFMANVEPIDDEQAIRAADRIARVAQEWAEDRQH